MKRCFAILCVCFLLAACMVPALADEGNVIYDGGAGAFIFQPGSPYSLTDLFPDFKDVMPGDSLSQPITVRNDSSNRVRIYMRALGAHEDSVEFLSKLHLRVELLDGSDAAELFDAPADETAQLTDWVSLGMLYPRGEVDLNVILDVPVELDNSGMEQIGYLDWEFMVQEYTPEPDWPDPDRPDVPDLPDLPEQPDIPDTPHTGDNSRTGLWISLMVISLIAIVVLLVIRRRNDRDQQE